MDKKTTQFFGKQLNNSEAGNFQDELFLPMAFDAMKGDDQMCDARDLA